MPPQVITAGLFILEEAIKQAPHLAEDIRAVLGTGDPKPEDFAALRAKVQDETYVKFVPQTAIPPEQQG